MNHQKQATVASVSEQMRLVKRMRYTWVLYR